MRNYQKFIKISLLCFLILATTIASKNCDHKKGPTPSLESTVQSNPMKSPKPTPSSEVLDYHERLLNRDVLHK